MTIHLTGKEALAEARYADIDPEILINTRFYNDREGRHRLLDPHEALEMVERQALKPEDLSCDVLSVWEHLERAGGPSGFLHIRPGMQTVLVLTRDQGSRLAEGVRGFAVLSAVFESAARWAKDTPITDPALDWKEFLSILQPRLQPRKQAWEQNGDLRKHAKEIAFLLIDFFGLDPESLSEDCLAKEVVNYVGEPRSCNGDFLDLVLERIQKTPFRSGNELLHR